MKIKDRPELATKPKPLSFAGDTPIRTAVAEMSKRNYGSVVVVDANQKVVGMVTERDLMRRLIDEGRDPETTKLSDIMSTEIRMARADDEVADWLRIMSNERFRRLPIVDENGRIQAMMTQGDFVSYTWPDLIYQAKLVTKATIPQSYQILLVVGGILIYSLLLATVLGA